MTYTYNGINYSTEAKLRQSIWETEHKAYGAVADWSKYGVAVKEAEKPSKTKSLAQAKSEAKAKINDVLNDWRDSSGYFLSSLGFKVSCDTASLQELIAKTVIGTSTAITDYDGQEQEVTAENLATLVGEAVNAIDAVKETASALKTKVESCTSIEEVSVINTSDFLNEVMDDA